MKAPGPLAAFNGAPPPAPEWFTQALADAPERSVVKSNGTSLELLTWGEVGKPGVLLLHGANSHADWWSFIAPFLAKDYRVAAMSWAGMGGSDWREQYKAAEFAEDALACARAARLFEAREKPAYVGHSFGGRIALLSAYLHAEHLKGAVLIDTGFGPPPPHAVERARRLAEIRRMPQSERPSRVYPTLAAGLARFRPTPEQPLDEIYIADFVARRALRRTTPADGAGEGWMWTFDPNFNEKYDGSPGSNPVPPGVQFKRPLSYIYGEESSMILRCAPKDAPLPKGTPLIGMPQAHHHVLLDQPLALVSVLRTQLAAWPA